MARHRIIERKWASEEQLKKIESEVREQVNAASEFATNDPEPNASELYTDVYR
jgi:pyruvate dehydrogenase E1 component alpha subunit